MKKRLLSILLTFCLALTLLPVTAEAVGSTLEVGEGSTYALTEAGLNAAISVASTGDTIKFISGGTITLTADLVINKSITLDLNGQTIGLNASTGFENQSLPNGYSVKVKGPGTITTDRYIENAATLTVEGGAVIEGTGDWQPMINYGTVSMTGGALRQTNGNYVLQNSGPATFDNVTIEASYGKGSVIWAAGDGTVTLNNCTTRNNFSGTMSGTLPSVILVSNSAELTINGGSVIAPAGSTLPAIEAYSGTKVTNIGATITNGYVKYTGKISVTTGNTTTSYINHADGWNAAAEADSEATVKLLENWTATADGENTSFGTGTGFDVGAILVPSGKTITLDLNGKTIDRALTQSAENGNVITVSGTLTIRDSSSTAVASQGTITGGYNRTMAGDSGGGILLRGTLTLEGGNISGNKSAGWGGGVKNEGGTFTMTGGKISGNIANYGSATYGSLNNCGGGVYSGTSFTMTGGEISGNSVCGSGNGLKGGGVFFYENATVGGTAVIRDNKSGCTYSVPDGTSVGIVSGGITDNVYLQAGKTLVCSTDTPLASGANIGVTTQTAPVIGAPVTITGTNGLGQTAYFRSDSFCEVISTDDIGLQLSVTAPGAPTIGTATAGNGQATVSFTAPASNGGAAITGYTVTSSPGGFTGTGTTSPITVTGLTNGTAYTFTVTATNSVGTSGASAASNSATPQVPPPSGGGGGGGGGSTPPAPVTRIDNGGSTTGSNIGQLVSGGKTLTVEADKGAKLVFDTEALKGIGGQTSGDIKVEMKDVSPAHQESLPGKQVFSLTVSSGSGTISNFGGSVNVTLPYTLNEGEKAEEVTVWYLASDGKMTEIPCTYNPTTKLATFSVTHFSLYVVGVPWQNPYTDVKESDWFYGAVEFVSQNGKMKGNGGSEFSPNTTVTRGMLVTILWRLEKEPAAAKTIDFTDVYDGNWYTKAVAWAAANNIVTGYAGMFNPDDALTREQLAAILYRYAAYKNYNVSATDSLSAYADKPSDWALSSVSWAVAKGLIKGSGSSLDPKGSATRAQAATILQRFIENTAK